MSKKEKNTMEKKLEDKALDLLIEEAVERLAEELKQEEFAEDHLSAEERAFRDEKKEIIWKEIQKQLPKQHRPVRRYRGKRVAVLVAALILIFSLALSNVSAVRTFLYRTYTDIKGTTLEVGTKRDLNKEYESVQDFTVKNEIMVPGWLPKDMILTNIEDEIPYVRFEYESEEYYLRLTESQVQDGTKGGIEMEGNQVKVKDFKMMDMEGVVVESTNEVGITTRWAMWNSDTMEYKITTNCPQLLLDAVLEKMEYLK